MKYQSNPIIFSVFLIISAMFCCYSASASVVPAPPVTGPTVAAPAAEVDDEREFDYLKDGKKGPTHWGDLKPNWAVCKNGKLQSPIDMTNGRVKIIHEFGELKKWHKPAQSVIKNRGHDISLQWPKQDAGWLEINNTKYILQQAHWHSPSEHTIKGKSFALELHMVHGYKDPQGKEHLAVLGQLYELGAPDQFLTMLMCNITAMINNAHVIESPMGEKDPNSIMAPCEGYFSYIGSLTVPPCTEGVIWILAKKVATVSEQQLRTMRQAVHDYAEKNARPVQQLNDREVKLYGGKDGEF